MSRGKERARVPYGPPILEAVASGDLQQMKAVAESARQALYGVELRPVDARNEADTRAALAELEAAIVELEGGVASPGGPLPPYGVAIRDAIARGDLQEMKGTAAAARRALYGVRFERTNRKTEAATREALAELEAAIRELEGGSA